jgi:hypothetical protein
MDQAVCQLEEVLTMPLLGVVYFRGHGELLQPELPHRLQHLVARLITHGWHLA